MGIFQRETLKYCNHSFLLMRNILPLKKSKSYCYLKKCLPILFSGNYKMCIKSFDCFFFFYNKAIIFSFYISLFLFFFLFDRAGIRKWVFGTLKLKAFKSMLAELEISFFLFWTHVNPVNELMILTVSIKNTKLNDTNLFRSF